VGALYFVNVFEEHRLLTVLVYLPVIMGFPFTIANFLLQGSRQFNLLNMIVFCQSLIWLVMVALVQNGILANNVYLIGLIYGLNCFFIYAILFFLALRILKLKLTNLFNFHTFKIAKNLIVTGLKFFFLQISSIFIFSLGNYLTYTNLNAESVAKYDTVNKIFLLMMSLYNIIIAVFWTDISHNIALKNKLKLKSIFKNLILISFVFDIAILLVYSCSPLLINFWTKGMIQITLKEIYGFPALMIFQSLALCGAVFLNAFEDFSIQIPFSLATSALIVPGVTLAFKYLHFGIGTVPIVTLILFLPGVYFCLNASIRRINSV
jgi:O-antigen/teichoic acid export membrane protein